MTPTFGFFIETRADRKRVKRGAISADRCHELGCRACPLNAAELKHPKMLASGEDHPDVYFLGEAPGANEDEAGKHFVGKVGDRLWNAVRNADAVIKVRRNNAINCHPPANRDPTTTEIECCRQRVDQDIAQAKPKMIIALGRHAASWFGLKGAISLWRGRILPVEVGGHACWLAPMLHPSFVLRNEVGGRDAPGLTEQSRAAAHMFDWDMKAALRFAEDAPAPKVLHESDLGKVELFYQHHHMPELVKALKQFIKAEILATDVETSSKRIRPYATGAKLLSISLSDGKRTIALGWDHPGCTFDPSDKILLKKLLRKVIRRVGKRKGLIAQNATYDAEWLNHFICPTFDLLWHDTMVQGYVLDERKGALSLDTLCFLAFGLRVKGLSDLDRRNLINIEISKVLKYNGYDTISCFLLFLDQRRRLTPNGLQKVYAFHKERIGPIARMQQKGVLIDLPKVESLITSVQSQVKEIEGKIQALPEVQSYRQRFGAYSATSPQQCATLLKSVLGRLEVVTKGGGLSSADPILQAINLPITNLTMKLRELTKLDSTYLQPLLPSSKDTVIYPDGRIHSSINHTGTDTARTSSDDPNNQNWPIREHPEIRGAVRASKGNWLLSVDEGQIEYRIIANASGDQTICRALKERYDVHMDWAQKIAKAIPYLLKPHEAKARRKYTDKADITKAAFKSLRSLVKNKMVFPAFYLAAVRKIAGYLDVPAKDVKLVEGIFEMFWSEFAGVKTWQGEMLRFYERNRYVESLMGRKRRGPLTRSMIVNTPIQSAASDVVVDAQVRLCRLAIERDEPWLAPVLLIHDDLTFDLPKAELDNALPIIIKEMICPSFPWLKVPLSAEAKFGPDWSSMKEIGTWHSDDLPKVWSPVVLS